MHISKINNILDSIKEMDIETYDHLERTSMFTFALGKELKFNPKQLEQVYFAGLLHDMGVLFSLDRNQKECANFGSLMLNLIDESGIIVKGIKHSKINRLIKSTMILLCLILILKNIRKWFQIFFLVHSSWSQ